MKLTPDQILDIVHNTLFTSVTPEGKVNFYRFSVTQQKAYAGRSENFGQKCYASAGVMLDMITDSDLISFQAEFGVGSSRKYAVIDLLVDGVLVETYRKDSLGTDHISFHLPQGEHRITLVLPWSATTTLWDLTLSDGASLLPVEKNPRILALGDSITQGYISEHPSCSYVSHYALALDAEVLNQGIGGYEFFKESVDPELGWQPDIITLAYGTNDYSHNNSLAVFTEQVKSYVEALVSAFPGTPVLAITPIYRSEETRKIKELDKDYTFEDAINKLHEIYAAYPQIRVLDGMSFYPHPIDFFAPDWLHPNDLGFAYYGQAVTNALKEML